MSLKSLCIGSYFSAVKGTWNDGMVEEWNNGVADYTQYSSIPIFQHIYTYTPHRHHVYFLCIMIILDTNETFNRVYETVVKDMLSFFVCHVRIKNKKNYPAPCVIHHAPLYCDHIQ